MTIVKRSKLSTQEGNGIRELEKICSSVDNAKKNLFLANDLNYYKDMDSFYLMYYGDKIIGVLSIFAPTKETAEISGIVHPLYRLKGVFKALIVEAKKDIKSLGYTTILYVKETVGKDENFWKYSFPISHTEYLMMYNKSSEELNISKKLEIRYATKDDIEKMAEITCEGFNNSMEDNLYRAKNIIERQELISYLDRKSVV